MKRSFRAAAGGVLITLVAVSGSVHSQSSQGSPGSGGSQGSAGSQGSQGSQGAAGAQEPAGQAPQPSAANPPDGQQQPPIFRAGVNFVRVDVIVTDKNGKPVDDLKAQDFQVTEAGRTQKIETFKLVALDGGLMTSASEPVPTIRTIPDEEREAARDDVRLFAMFLDDYHVKRDSSLVMRQQLARFVETQLGPSDMIGLMYPLQAVASVRMSRNHDAIRRGIAQFEGRKYDYTPKNDAEAQYVDRVSPEQIERMRNQASFGALKALIMQMGSLKEGRKALILVSEGYSNSLPPQLAIPSVGGVTTAPRPPANSGMETTRQFFDSMDVDMDLRDIYDLANRNNVAIYAVDPRGLAGSEFGIDQPNVDIRTDSRYLTQTMDTLRQLAENTDGRAIVNRNDLAIAMKQIVVDSSAYYLLGYSSNMATPDGKFHEIDVKVNRPGAQVRHRKGYWALKAEDAARITAPAAKPASPVESALVATATHRSRFIRTWIGTERGDNGKTRVTFVWEPMPRVPGEVARDSDRPVRVALTAASTDGPFFRGRAPDTAATSPATTAAGSRVTFDADPGKVQLRISIEGAGADVIDSELRDITVPDLSSPQTTFGTPEVYRARTLPELQRLKSDPQPVPAVSREFSRAERLLLRVAVYGPAGTTPKLTASLVNRGGQPMSELPVAAPEGTRTESQIELSLSNLPVGEYGIALTATGEGGDAKELVAFRVMP